MFRITYEAIHYTTYAIKYLKDIYINFELTD